MKELILKCEYEYDDYECIRTSQKIKDENNGIDFSVNNLTWCAEDAIIDRGLFNADDYIKVLNKGIELAKKGYDKVNLTYERINESN